MFPTFRAEYGPKHPLYWYDYTVFPLQSQAGAVLSISVKNGRVSLFYFFRACPLQFFLFRSIIYYEKVLNYRVEEQHDKNRI